MTASNNIKRVVVITGASRGIGKECAIKLAQPNTHLILMARKKEELDSVAKECLALGATPHTLPIDILKDNLKEVVSNIKNQFGNIDILINNAGIWIEKPFTSGDMDEWDDALDVNLKSAIHLTRYCLDGMPEGGSVIFIGSTASRKSYAGGTNYCAAKFGLLGFANSLFEDIRERGIKVCSILPGVVNTDMHKDDPSFTPEKMIQPQDVAATVQFILSTPSNMCPTEITLMPQKNPKNWR
jgi:NADP-dependent 3-hydroxy acid dehydrogenase YdfG